MKLTYSMCQILMVKARKNRKKIDNNTYLEYHKTTNCYQVKLHDNTIMIIEPKQITLTHSGWKTSTTKDRLNKFGPISIYQKNYQWFYDDVVPFNDMVTLNV